MSNRSFVAAAFVATWIALIGYLGHLQRVTRKSRELLARATERGRR